MPVKPLQLLFKITAIPLLLIALFFAGKGDFVTFGVFVLPAIGLYLGVEALPRCTDNNQQERALLIPVGFILLSIALTAITQ